VIKANFSRQLSPFDTLSFGWDTPRSAMSIFREIIVLLIIP
jgi:hypothetical protein